ncbi:hypothetical protein MTO96_040417 [Rhipicephalus appendiculatus]
MAQDRQETRERQERWRCHGAVNRVGVSFEPPFRADVSFTRSVFFGGLHALVRWGKKAKSKGAKPNAASQPTKPATTTLTTGLHRADGPMTTTEAAATALTTGRPHADDPTMSETQKVLQDFFKDDEDKLACERIARKQHHQLEQQAVAVIGDWLTRKTTRSRSVPLPVSRELAEAQYAIHTEWERRNTTAIAPLESAASVALPESSEDDDMDVAVASRKRARDDDESECPRKQAQTGCTPTPSPSDPGTPRDTTATPIGSSPAPMAAELSDDSTLARERLRWLLLPFSARLPARGRRCERAIAQVASLTQAVEALANRSSSTNPTSFGQAPEAMDSAPSEHRDTAAHLAPLEARLGGLESQMASIVTTIEDRLAAALQTVFDRIPGMIVAQMPQLSVSTRRPKLKRVSRSQAPRPLSQVAEVDEQSSSSAATSEVSTGSSSGAPMHPFALPEAPPNV